MKKINRKTTKQVKKKLTKRLVVFIVIITLLTLALISPKENFIKTTARKLFSGNNPISSVDITTDDYDEEGSIKVIKEAHWVSKTEAELDIKLDTIRKTGDNKKDIILVFDVSGSMEGDKLEKVKQDATELIEYVLDKDEDNKIGLITFASESRIISPLTNNKESLLEAINNMSTEDATNYYLAYKDIETILEGYSKETGKDLVVLFMTDGVPTDGNSAQGVYESLKEQYPYITINAVEYEKGKTASDTVSISDNQWVANMDTFNNVLFEATVSPEVYEKLRIDDYIDDEHFEIETNTPSKGSVSIDNNKITWRFTNNSYTTGSKETLKVRLKLKDEYKDVKGLYQTNKNTEIKYKIDTEKETTSTLTPVLKNNYDVIYDINAPETCNLENPESENHFIYDTVTMKDIEPKCTGYTFKGWQIEERDVKYKSEDTIIMPEEDVHIKAIWSRQTMKAYMDGTVYEKTTLYKTIESDDVKTGAAKLYIGEHQDSLTIPGTENIYYYNGNVTTNNVIFAGFCWQIIRTTDTGGVKLIYNGTPSSQGTCDNDGDATTIGKSTFNTNDNSPAYVGYMYNTVYPYNSKQLSPQSTILQRVALNKNHYFSNVYEYNQSVSNIYKLQNNSETDEDERFTAEECLSNSNCNEVLTGTYTFSNTNPDYSNTTIRYVVGVIGEYVYYLDLKNGQILDDINSTFYIGDGYTDNGNGTYTIKNESESPTETYKKSEWITKYLVSKNKYICIGSNPCSNPIYTTATTIQSYNAESLNNNYIYANDFDYVLNEETSEYEYVLKDTNISNKMQFWDWHNNYNQLNNNHYTCFNTTGKCQSIYYIYYIHNTVPSYITIKDGKSINNAFYEMLYDSTVNQKNSNIKSLIDRWFSNNLLVFDDYIEDVIYCNDRNTPKTGNDILNNTGWNPNGGNMFKYLYFATDYRNNRKYYKCNNETDSFMVSNEKAKLTYPVGMLTNDEALSATMNSYLNNHSYYWLLSPYGYRYAGQAIGTQTQNNAFKYFDQAYIFNSVGVRPVISLKPEIEYTEGDGSKNNPYVIDTSDGDNDSSEGEP